MSKLNGIHIVKRGNISRRQMVLHRIIAVLLALVTGGLFILAMGYNPLSVYGTMVTGSLGSQMVIKETVKQAVPLLISALGITLARPAQPSSHLTSRTGRSGSCSLSCSWQRRLAAVCTA